MADSDSTASGPQITGFEIHERIGSGGSDVDPVRRRVAIALAGVALVGAIAVGIVVTSGGDDEPVSTGPIVIPDDTVPGGDVFFEFIDAPSDVQVSIDPDGAVQISFEEVSGAVGYEAESRPPSTVTGELRTELIDTDDGLAIATGLTVEDAPCWVVRSIGDGRRSRDSPLACAGL